MRIYFKLALPWRYFWLDGVVKNYFWGYKTILCSKDCKDSMNPISFGIILNNKLFGFSFFNRDKELSISLMNGWAL